MNRSFSLISQLAILAFTAGACAFAASPTVLSGGSLVSSRGGEVCTVGHTRLAPHCEIADGYMECTSPVLRCNYTYSPKTRTCTPKGSTANPPSACNKNFHCKDDIDDILHYGCDEVM
ncbi:MAG: hypothetical protein IAF94_24825 [Pirellulaceae bacterium]|nr:hypothetical protein [Pirellulaceae bacterium]